MKTKTIPISVEREYALCEKDWCGGELRFTGQAYTMGMGKTKYNHVCYWCGAIEVLDDAYPRIVYLEQEPPYAQPTKSRTE